MAATTRAKNERIDVRVDSDVKALFARAAEISGVSMTRFVVETAKERAEQLVSQHERIVLENQARDTFLNALANPPAPNEALRRAAEKFATR
jgi:uncharacterized protein (DUF1778 family)